MKFIIICITTLFLLTSCALSGLDEVLVYPANSELQEGKEE